MSVNYDRSTTNNIKSSDIDLTKVSGSAAGALNGETVKVNASVWENGNLTYKLRDDGTAAIMNNGQVIGFVPIEALWGNGTQANPYTEGKTEQEIMAAASEEIKALDHIPDESSRRQALEQIKKKYELTDEQVEAIYASFLSVGEVVEGNKPGGTDAMEPDSIDADVEEELPEEIETLEPETTDPGDGVGADYDPNGNQIGEGTEPGETEEVEDPTIDTEDPETIEEEVPHPPITVESTDGQSFQPSEDIGEIGDYTDQNGREFVIFDQTEIYRNQSEFENENGDVDINWGSNDKCTRCAIASIISGYDPQGALDALERQANYGSEDMVKTIIECSGGKLDAEYVQYSEEEVENIMKSGGKVVIYVNHKNGKSGTRWAVENHCMSLLDYRYVEDPDHPGEMKLQYFVSTSSVPKEGGSKMDVTEETYWVDADEFTDILASDKIIKVTEK